MKIAVLVLFSSVAICQAQMIPDAKADTTVPNPAYKTVHPELAIDQAHGNIHTKDGLFKPFAQLAGNDGYHVVANVNSFTKDSLKGIDVLVISNPLGDLSNDNNNSTPAFTQAECDAVFDWVQHGGSLFLIADHAPIGDAAQPLAQRFGTTLGNNFVFDTNPDNFTSEDVTELVFSERNQLLGQHPIRHGRNESERLHRLVAFTGESVSIPKGATALLMLSPTAGEVSTGSDLRPMFDKDAAKAKASREAALKRAPAGAQAMAIAFPVGQGRVVISGEAGMMTAQVFEEKQKDGSEKISGAMGWDVSGNDDRQYVLNILHWLSGALETVFLDIQAAAQPRISASDLDHLVQDKRYPELEQQLQLAHLSSIDRGYFTGIVADRNNHPLDAIVDLEKVLPELRRTSPRHTAVALRTLAGDYFKTGRYGEASDTYSDVLKHFASEFSAAEKQEMTDNRNIFGLLRGAAPQTVSGEHEFTTPIRSNPLGDVEVPILIGSTTEWWILDTGANESSITVSTAKRFGLTLSQQSASTQSGATGKEVPLRAAVIPKLALGGTVVKNVVVLVSEDKAFNVNLGKNGHYQIEGVLGYPVLAALGSLTIVGDELQVHPESQPSPRSSRLYLEELTPLLEASVDGHDLLFGLDTGSDAASFTAKYLREFPKQFASLKPKKWGVGGVGGIRWMRAYDLPQVDLHFGTATATLKKVPVVTRDVGVDPLDAVFGNLGQSLLHQFRSYTIDFSHMRFTAGENAN